MVLFQFIGRAFEKINGNSFALQAGATFIMGIMMLVLLFYLGYGQQFVGKGHGIWYTIGAGGYLIVTGALALASGIGQNIGIRPFLDVSEIMLFALAMLGVGFTEELLFRGVITGILKEKFGTSSDKGIFLVIVVQSVLFGCFHFSNIFAGVGIKSVLVQVVLTMFLGAVICAIYLRTNHLFFVILLHAWIDFGALSSAGLFGENTMAGSLDQYSGNNLLVIPLYIIVIAILLRKSKRKDIKEQVLHLPHVGLRIAKGIICTILSILLVVLCGLGTLHQQMTGSKMSVQDTVSSSNRPESYMIKDENKFEYQEHMECGGYASAYVMRALGDKSAEGLEVYKKISGKSSDGTMAPDTLVSFFKEQGYQATLYTGDISSLEQRLTQGVPVIVFVRVSENSSVYHYCSFVG